MKHSKQFENYSDFEKVKDSLIRPNISLIKEGYVVEYLYDQESGDSGGNNGGGGQ